MTWYGTIGHRLKRMVHSVLYALGERLPYMRLSHDLRIPTGYWIGKIAFPSALTATTMPTEWELTDVSFWLNFEMDAWAHWNYGLWRIGQTPVLYLETRNPRTLIAILRYAHWKFGEFEWFLKTEKK